MESDTKKTKAQLIEELDALRGRMAEIELKNSPPNDPEATDFAFFFDAMDIPASFVNRQYAYEAVNAAYERYLGETRAGIVGRTAAELIGEQIFNKEIRPRLDRCLGGEQVNYQAWIDFPGMGRRLMDVSYSPRYGREGEVIGVLHISRDMTERHQLEIMSTTILETALHGFWVSDTSGRILRSNKAASDMLGYSEDELKSLFIWQIDVSECRSDTEKRIRDIMASGRGRFEARHMRKDGTIIDVEVDATYLDQSGGLFIVFFKDITEQIQTQKALIASRGQYYELIDNALFPVVITSLDNDKVLYINKFASEFFDVDARRARGLTASSYWHSPEDRIGFIETLRRNGTVSKIETRLKTESSETRDVVISANIIDFENEQAILTVFNDVTKRKAAENALKASEESVRRKLDSILMPESDIDVLELQDIVDIDVVQSLMDDFYDLTSFPVSLVDMNGKILVATGWQDICTQFHRAHPETARRCHESDLILSSGVQPGQFKIYRCKNNMWDIVTPLFVGDKHLGNLFLGQFLYEDEVPDYEAFRKQARRYDFDEDAYLAALDRVPRWSRKTVDTVMRFYSKFANSMSRLSYANIKLAKALSERKQLVEQLASSETRLRNIFDNAPVGIYQTTPDGKFISCNNKLAEMLGYSNAELLNIGNIADLYVNPAQREVVKQRLAGQNAIEGYDIHLRRKDDTTIWMSIYVKTRRDSNGDLLFYEGFSLDATERKHAEENLRVYNERLTLATDSAGIGVWELDLRNDRLFWDDWMLRIYGLGADRFSNKYKAWTSSLHPADKDFAIDEFRLAVQGRKDFDTHFRILRPEGEERHIKAAGKVLRNENGVPSRMIGVNFDITEAKNAERALHSAKQAAETANRTKSEFLANMSHEIRTPLNGIMGMLQLMQTTDLAEEQSDYLKTAIQSARRLSSLLSDILDLTKVEAGRQAIRKAPFALSETILQVVELFTPLSKQTGVKLRSFIDPAIPEFLLGDMARVHQVLNNLVGNALKFTESGTVTIEAYPIPAPRQEESRILFCVSDTGIGIPDNTLEKLFVPFTQASEGYTKNFQGAGLGLAICKQLVTLMGGNISVSSDTDNGTTVHVCIPFERVVANSPSQEIAIHQPQVAPLSLKVLLAEDDRVSSLAAMRQLEIMGCEVTTVTNGRDVLKALRIEDFDLVLMDVQMPVMDGEKATMAIRQGKAGRRCKDITIIALTGYAMTGDREKFLNAGMNGHLAKPIEMQDLRAAIEQVKGMLPEPPG